MEWGVKSPPFFIVRYLGQRFLTWNLYSPYINHKIEMRKYKTMTHAINEDILNSNIEYCINEYVRIIEHRDILRDKWFYDYSLEQIAEKYNKSLTAVKDIIYKTGDKILLKASKMSTNTV